MQFLKCLVPIEFTVPKLNCGNCSDLIKIKGLLVVVCHIVEALALRGAFGLNVIYLFFSLLFETFLNPNQLIQVFPYHGSQKRFVLFVR